MNGIEITTTITQADWRAYQAAWGQRLQLAARGRGARLKSLGLLFAISFAVAIAVSALAARLDERMPFIAFILGVALSLATVAIIHRRMQARATPDADGVLLGRCSMSFSGAGIEVQKEGARGEYAWRLVQEATVTKEHLFVWIDRMAALIIPLRDFPPGSDPRAIVADIQAMAAAAGREIAPLPPSAAAHEHVAPHTATSPTTPFKDFLRASARLLTLRTADPSALAAHDRTAAAILACSLGVLIGIEWLLAERGSQFHPYGLLVCSWYALVALIAAWLGSRLSEPRVQFRALVLVAIVLTPVAVAVRLLTFWAGHDLRIAILAVTGMYALLVLERSLRSITMLPQPRVLVATMLLVCMTAWMSERFYLSTEFWYPNFDEYEEGEGSADGASFLQQWRAAEKTLFEQSERIRASIDALERPASLEFAAFFLGFAGMGEQRVFAGEIALADRVIAERFGTAARAMRLVNDRRDLNALPLASPTALRYTLKSLARKMDLERDVLFLALSSHGSEKAFISVSNSSLPLNDLTALELADALREAGMKWRVIIVSACYAGTFIEPLRDDHTIVIAAAAADRTSFGCSDERDVTYFGEAFYRDSLPGAASLRDAFENATRLVSEREKLEGKTASNPAAHFGSAIERLLADRFAHSPADTEVAARPQL